MIITSPYNFVPLNEDIYYPEWGDKVSHDMPFSDAEDGTIEVTVENVSPLFTRNGQASGTSPKDKTPYSAHIMTPDGRRLYYIPGTSIKGMLRSTMEVMAFGKMEQKTHYTNRWFGHREVGVLSEEGQDYHMKMEEGNVKAGWLELRGEAMYLYPCVNGFKTVEIEELSVRFPSYMRVMRKKSPWEVNNGISNHGYLYPDYQTDDGVYRLVCTGFMQNTKPKGKAHEYLFSAADESNRKEIAKEVKERFESVYEPSPHFEDYIKYMKKGNRIAIFYIEENYRVEYIGLSRFFRYPYQRDLNQLVGFQQKIDKKRYDLPETIFGSATKDSSLKGRVQISNAFCSVSISDSELSEVKLLLGQPKASYYPLYLQQTNKPYKTYDTATAIAGRKFYRVFHNGETTDLKEMNENNENVKSTLRCIPSGHTFSFRINVHNMKPIEIGAILSALTFHNTQTSYHTIGQAKNFGYGKLGHADIKLRGLQKSVDEYLRDFELTMNIFTMSRKKPFKWNESKQLKKLVNITSEHEVSTLQIMTLNEFKESKKRDAFCKLEQLTDNKVKTLLSEDDLNAIDKIAKENYLKDCVFEIKGKYNFLEEQVNACLLKCDYSAAVKAYNDIIVLCSDKDVSHLVEVSDILNRTKQALEENKASLLIQCCDSMFDHAKLYKEEYLEDKAIESYQMIERWCNSSGLLEQDDIMAIFTRAKKEREGLKANAYKATITTRYEKAKSLEASGNKDDLQKAVEKYEAIKDDLSKRGLATDAEDAIIAALTTKIAKLEAEEQDDEEKEKLRLLKAKLDAGITTILDEKYTEGPNAGKYKIKDLKVCNDRVRTWLRDTKIVYGRETLTDEEKEALVNTVRRIKQTGGKLKPFDKDKEWNTRLADYIGKDKAFELYNE